MSARPALGGAAGGLLAGLLAGLALARGACAVWRDAAMHAALAFAGPLSALSALAAAARHASDWVIEHAELGAYAAGAWAVARDMAADAPGAYRTRPTPAPREQRAGRAAPPRRPAPRRAARTRCGSIRPRPGRTRAPA